MDVRITDIEWKEQEQMMNTLLADTDHLSVEALNQGFEAEVVKLNFQQESFVLKVWNKESNPNIEQQYLLLKWLSEQGMNVSKPIGWGIDRNGDKALLTTYDGKPLEKINVAMMSEFARILSNLHRISTEDGDALLPKFDLIDYFFPGVSEHADLFQALTHFVQLAQIKHDRFIHGDYHLNNIVENDEQYTVIDWTNAQMGDSRYDFAWSLVLVKIYLDARHAAVFRFAYLQDHPLEQQELDLFEAIACLRWLLLDRRDGVPRSANTLHKVMKLIDSNPFLSVCEIADFPVKKLIKEEGSMDFDVVFDEFPILGSEKLNLQPIEAGHLDDVFDIYNNDKVFNYCGILPKHNKETVKNMIGHFERDYMKRTKIKWGIFAKQEGDKLVGILEAFNFDRKVEMVTIGYFLAESYWGKGIATEAVRLLVSFLFEQVNVNRIQAEVMPGNEPSKRVLLKNGFIKEGTIRQGAIWTGKGIVDLEIYGILKEEYAV